MKRLIPTAIAVLVGLLTLLGYVVVPSIQIHQVFIGWAAILAAVAFVIGILNLLGTHLRRILDGGDGWVYSVFLVLSAVIVLVVAAIEGQGPGGPALSWVFHNILSPLEAAVASLLVFFMVAAAFRAMRTRASMPILVMMVTTVLILIGALALPGSAGQLFSGVRDWLVHVFATAGARGMLLGVALGTLATGLRLLVGIDRPHSEREP